MKIIAVLLIALFSINLADDYEEKPHVKHAVRMILAGGAQ